MGVVGVSEAGPGHQERQMGSRSIPANFSSGRDRAEESHTNGGERHRK